MYRIGELAKLNHIKTDTLRFYEKHGLLIPSMRTDSGYRVYSDNDAERLNFILRAKAVGFTLAEIAELLSIEIDKSHHSCRDVKTIVDDKLTKISLKIKELAQFSQSLQLLSNSCCGGAASAECCSILEALKSCDSEIKPTPEAAHHAHFPKGELQC